MGNSQGNYFPTYARTRSVVGVTTLGVGDLYTILIANSLGGPYTVTVPAANAIGGGGEFIVVAPDGATNTVSVALGGSTWNGGQASPILLQANNAAVRLISTGTEYFAIVTGTPINATLTSPMINDSGGPLVGGEPVVPGSVANSVTTTAVPSSIDVVGVVVPPGGPNGSTIQIFDGGTFSVTASGVVAIGDHLATDAVAGQVIVDPGAFPGVFLIAVDSKGAGVGPVLARYSRAEKF